MRISVYYPLLLLIGLVSAGKATAQKTIPVARIDSIFAQFNKPGVPGVAVGVVHNGRLVYAKGFGEADLETGAKITPQTIFHVASVSKQFTAYAMVMLARQGKLSLDDDIRKHIPEIPDFGKTITIRNLIHHTSGLRDQWNLLALAGWGLDDVITKQHVMNLVTRQKELNFDPGTAHNYCNTGYTLLGEIAARVSGKPFPEWMKQNVFTPLGMKSTLFYDDQEGIVKGRAYSFHKTEEGAFRKAILSYGNVGATSLFTTVNDLALWINNFKTGQLGGPAVMKQMLEKGRLTKGDTIPYAFALVHGKYKGLVNYGHGGADAGFRSMVTYYPEQDYGFIVLGNQGEINTTQKTNALADVVLEEFLTPEKSVPKPKNETFAAFDSTRFRAYAGTYELKNLGLMLSFKKDGDRYMTQAAGQPWIELFPSSDSTFFLKVVDASIVFHKEKDGSVDRVTLRQNGEHAGTRVDVSKMEQIAPEQFAGTYYSPELETTYKIILKGKDLKLSHVHHGEADLTIAGKDRLNAPFWFAPNLDIVRDNTGAISGLKISSGRVMNVWFKKLDEGFAGGGR